MGNKKAESFPEAQYVDPKLVETDKQQGIRFGLLNNPSYRALILEGFGFTDVVDFGVDDNVSFSSCRWILLATEYITHDPEQIFRVNNNFSGQIIECRLQAAEDAYSTVGRSIIQNLPRKVVGIKVYSSLSQARSDVDSALKFLGLNPRMIDEGGLIPFQNPLFSKTIDFINGCIYHYQNNYSGMNATTYIHCAESFALEYFKELSKIEKEVSASFSPYIFGSFAKHFSMIHYQANSNANPELQARQNISSRVLYKAFVSSFGHQVSGNDLNCLVELLNLRQIICASNPHYLPDPTKKNGEHIEEFQTATKSTPPLGEDYAYNVKSTLDEDTSNLIEDWNERESSHGINFISKIDSLLVKKYQLDKLIGIRHSI